MPESERSALAARPRKGDLVEVVVEELDDRGRVLGRLAGAPDSEGPRVRLRGAPPGARVRARAGRSRRGVLEVFLQEVLDPGPEAVEARCHHARSCGGCSFQELDYAAQLRHQARLLARTLAPLGEELSIAPVLSCDEPWNYRNKMDFTFASRRWIEADEPEGVAADFALGLHVPGRFDKVLDVERCDIAFTEAAPIVRTTRRLASERGLEPWDVRAHRGLLRHLVLRKGFATGEVMADLVTTEEAPEAIDELARAIHAQHPEITTFVQHVNPGVALVATGEGERVLFGAGFIHEELCGLTFTISASSFFQTNTAQAERLMGLVAEAAGLRAGDTLFDLYCGGGALSLALAAGNTGSARPRSVWGFELVASAVADAERNARANGVSNAGFVAGDLVQTLSPDALASRRAPRPDVCVIDPPRAGAHERVLRSLVELAPARVAYVSCNPRSAVRDVAFLNQAGYGTKSIRPIDLFPHTPHLECVFALEREA